MTDQIQLLGYVNQKSPRAESEGVWAGLKANKRGEACVIDFFTEMALEGRAFQVRAGTITTPLTGDVLITDTKAEMASDIILGVTFIPVFLNIAIRLGTGTLHEYAAKSVAAAVTTPGTAFVALPLYTGGVASLCSASTGAAGGVVVAAEVVTTTRRHWSYSNPVAVAAGHSWTTHVWEPRVPPVLAGVASFYVQVAATTTGPDHYSSYDYIELPTISVS